MKRRRSVLRFLIGLAVFVALVYALTWLFTEHWGA
jgi:hypothetical protein